MLTLIKDFLGGRRCFPGNDTPGSFWMPQHSCFAHSIAPGPECGPCHTWCPGTVLPSSHTNLAQFGLVIGNVFLLGGHDDPASESLLAKSLRTHQGSHTYKRRSSQPSESLRRRRRRSRSVLPGEESGSSQHVWRGKSPSLTSPQQQHRVLVEEAPPACVLHPQAAFKVLQQSAKC